MDLFVSITKQREKYDGKKKKAPVREPRKKRSPTERINRLQGRLDRALDVVVDRDEEIGRLASEVNLLRTQLTHAKDRSHQLSEKLVKQKREAAEAVTQAARDAEQRKLGTLDAVKVLGGREVGREFLSSMDRLFRHISQQSAE
jgi:methyl-accepting chemotaxis protein